EMAISRGIPTAVDPKKRNFHSFKNVSLFKPNFKEFTEGVGIQLDKNDFAAIKNAADSFRQKQNIKLLFITLSELGVFIGNGAEEKHYPALIRDISDVSGAGDTVISVASLAMAASLDQKTIAFMSNLAGGLVCGKTGVVPVNKNQLINEMKEQNI
ncbi:MAG TPA: PfkB family carbohydrate kinase, partial [Draconibacterium sp.]|nr:PfkB family carbohydrate kinase [Draconibacterium sp.]